MKMNGNNISDLYDTLFPLMDEHGWEMDIEFRPAYPMSDTEYRTLMNEFNDLLKSEPSAGSKNKATGNDNR